MVKPLNVAVQMKGNEIIGKSTVCTLSVTCLKSDCNSELIGIFENSETKNSSSLDISYIVVLSLNKRNKKVGSPSSFLHNCAEKTANDDFEFQDGCPITAAGTLINERRAFTWVGLILVCSILKR